VGVATDLLMQTVLDAPLVHCPDVLEPKGHSDVTEGPKQCDEGGLLLVLDLHLDLVLT
jgi:hypothetical protein